MLAQLATEYGFTYFTLAAETPAGQRLAEVSQLPFPPGIYVDLELIAYGRPSAGRLRREFAERFPRQTDQREEP